MLEDKLFDQLEEGDGVNPVTDHSPIDILLVDYYLCALAQQQRVNLAPTLKAISNLTVGSSGIAVCHLLVLCQLHLNLVLEFDSISKDLVLGFLLLSHELANYVGQFNFIINDCLLQL